MKKISLSGAFQFPARVFKNSNKPHPIITFNQPVNGNLVISNSSRFRITVFINGVQAFRVLPGRIIRVGTDVTRRISIRCNGKCKGSYIFLETKGL